MDASGTEIQLQSDIARLLELIQISNYTLEQLRQAGKSEDSLPFRQEKHLHRPYTHQLNQIMKKFKLSVHALEE